MTTGDAYFFGKSLLHEMKEIRKELGVCPQQNLLIDVLTVGMNEVEVRSLVSRASHIVRSLAKGGSGETSRSGRRIAEGCTRSKAG